MSAPGRQSIEQQQVFVRQANILRRNLMEWDRTLRSARGEDWPRMLGRLNAAANQATNLDGGIEDVTEHFVYVPRKCPVNPQDVPFFLSTRLTDAPAGTEVKAAEGGDDEGETKVEALEDPVKALRRYEERAAELAADFEEAMVRF